MKTTMTRQNFNKLTATALPGATVSASCSEGGGLTYKELVKSTWRHTDTRSKKGQELLRELVRYATLAANSHNTQPWLFRIETNRITILPDFSRRCTVVDPDDHHLYVSLGCATENLVLAAAAYGFQANVSFDRSADGAIVIDLQPGVSVISSGSSMFQAIPSRQCTRADYDGTRIPGDQLSVLEGKAQDEGVAVQMFTDKTALEQILEYVVAGNTAQINDEGFVKELRHWIRFNESAIIKHRDGLFSASSGNPTLPTWMGKVLFNLAFRESSENDKYSTQIRSSSGAIAFISTQDNKESWIKLGRCYQRFALQSTAFGIAHAFINQPVEVPNIRQQFGEYLNTGGRRVDLLLRFGYGPELPRSLRRPVEQVIV